jgi:hypothetical protein
MQAVTTTHTYKFGDGDLDLTLNASGDTLDLPAGEYKQAYKLDVQEGQGTIFGRGSSEAPQFAEGFAGMRFVSDAAAAQATGDWRITVRTPQDRLVAELVSGDLEEFDLFTGAAGSGSQKDRDSRRPFSLKNRNAVTKQYNVWLEIRADSAITIDDAEAETKALIEGYKVERTA